MFPILSGYPTSIGSAGLYASGGHSPSCVSSGRLASRSGESHARASVACFLLWSRLVAAVPFRSTPLVLGSTYPSSWLASCCDWETPPFDALAIVPAAPPAL